MIVFLAVLGFWVGALADVVTSRTFRRGERWAWLLVVLFGFVFGAILYLAVGRQWGTVGHDHPSRLAPESRPGARPIGPDDDPDFLGSCRAASEY